MRPGEDGVQRTLVPKGVNIPALRMRQTLGGEDRHLTFLDLR